MHEVAYKWIEGTSSEPLNSQIRGTTQLSPQEQLPSVCLYTDTCVLSTVCFTLTGVK